MRRNEKGLTLIELLAIVLVILTLVSLAVPPFLSARTRAQIAQVQQDLQVIESAVEWYYMDHKRYPESMRATILSESQDRKDEGLLRLMTPIRYLDGVPEERFSDSSLINNSELLYEFGAGGNPSQGNPIDAWIVISRGPDGDMDSRHVSTFPLGTVAVEYNPTNGLRSDGDIVRYGGDFGDGNWFLNGRRISPNPAR